jgi:hypothetical protein
MQIICQHDVWIKPSIQGLYYLLTNIYADIFKFYLFNMYVKQHRKLVTKILMSMASMDHYKMLRDTNIADLGLLGSKRFKPGL